jgi:hypothetical protein
MDFTSFDEYLYNTNPHKYIFSYLVIKSKNNGVNLTDPVKFIKKDSIKPVVKQSTPDKVDYLKLHLPEINADVYNNTYFPRYKKIYKK